MDQFPEEPAASENTSRINESRRRRTRRLIVPSGRTERSLYVNEIAKRLVPSLDFFLFSALCGLILGAAILFDHPAIYILAALLAPFMSPLVGLGFSTAVGSFKFFAQSLGSLAIGSALVFIGGIISGWISKTMPGFQASQARLHTSFSVPDLILVLVGTIMAVYLTVRVPKQRSLVASAALAYAVYVPIAVAGFGLTSGMHGLLGGALKLAGINILLVIMIGTIVLAFMRMRPFTLFGYLLTLILLGGAAYALFVSGAMKNSLSPEIITETSAVPLVESETIIVQATETPQPPTATIPIPVNSTPTNTLVPTRTPTVTDTPKPAEVWATVNIEVGIYIRTSPCKDLVKCPKNGAAVAYQTPVLVLSGPVYNDGVQWMLVHLDDGREGWVDQSYLLFDS